MLTSVDEVAEAIANGDRFSQWSVQVTGEWYVELVSGEIILVLVWPTLWRDRQRFEPHLIRARTGNYSLILLGRDEDFIDGKVDELEDVPDLMTVPIPVPRQRLAVAIRSRGEETRLRCEKAAVELNLERAHHENELLISIGRALSQQRDILSLLDLILSRAREVSGADAGSVYIVQGNDEDVSKRILQFTISQNDSRPQVEFKGFTMPVSSESIVGTCVLSAETINIPDLYKLDDPGTSSSRALSCE